MAKSQLTELVDRGGLGFVEATQLLGREFKSREKLFVDYCTTNYLSFDFDPLMKSRGLEFADKWGSLTGWSRLEADPVIYTELEKKLGRFIGCGDIILSHTITITNFSLIPAIAAKGLILCDQKVHTVVWEACRLARDHGATLTKFRHQDLEDLESQLRANAHVSPKIIAVDGVYSISTAVAPLEAMLALCEKYDAWLYVDDAHGFGVLGSEPTLLNPYGLDGRGVVAHAGVGHDRIFYVSSFGKAFCTHTAFASVPKAFRGTLREKSLQYIFSAPVSPYVIGMADASLDLNAQRGNQERDKLRRITERLVRGLESMDLKFLNHGKFPVVYWEVGSIEQLVPVAEQMMNLGILAGIRAFPIVPPNECGFRFGLTSSHTDAQIDRTLEVIRTIVSNCSVRRAA